MIIFVFECSASAAQETWDGFRVPNLEPNFWSLDISSLGMKGNTSIGETQKDTGTW